MSCALEAKSAIYNCLVDVSSGVCACACACVESGFMATATISGDSSCLARAVHVSLQFEQQNITSSSCSECLTKVWCRHIIAAILYRIRHAQQVRLYWLLCLSVIEYLFHPVINSLMVIVTHTHTHARTHAHTHNCFMALLDFVWDYPVEPAPER